MLQGWNAISSIWSVFAQVIQQELRLVYIYSLVYLHHQRNNASCSYSSRHLGISISFSREAHGGSFASINSEWSTTSWSIEENFLRAAWAKRRSCPSSPYPQPCTTRRGHRQHFGETFSLVESQMSSETDYDLPKPWMEETWVAATRTESHHRHQESQDCGWEIIVIFIREASRCSWSWSKHSEAVGYLELVLYKDLRYMILSFSLTFVSSRSSSQKVAMVACVLLPPRSLHFLISIYNSFGASHDCKQHRGLNIGLPEHRWLGPADCVWSRSVFWQCFCTKRPRI